MDFESKPAGPFWQKRNIIAMFVWCGLFFLLVVGITVNACLFNAGVIEANDVYRRLFYSFLCLVMMSVVFVVEWLFRIRFPLFLEIVLAGFAFAALAGGTVFNLYGIFPSWDKVLHTLSGPLFFSVGLCLADLLLKQNPAGAKKAVAFIVFAFFFSLAVSCLWEIFEYSVDSLIPGYNNQRWAAGVVEELENGYFIVTDKRGTALNDTMWDMILNLIGTVVVTVPSLLCLVKRPERLEWFRTDVLSKRKNRKKN